MSNTTPRTRQELEETIISRAYEDESFRQALLADPKATLAAEFNGRFPDKVNVHVHEESADDLHLVVPIKQDEVELQQALSEEDLEAVAGGNATAGTFSLYSIVIDWECITCQ